METRKSNLIMLAVILAIFPIYVLTGCKKKVQSTDAGPAEIFDEEQPVLEIPEGEQFSRAEEKFSYPSSEDDEEFAEEPQEDEEYENEEDDDSDEPNDEEDDEEDDEEEPDDDYYDDYEEEPNEPDDEEPNDDWY